MLKNIDLLHLAALKVCLRQVYCPNSSYGPSQPANFSTFSLRYEDLKEPLISLKFLAMKQGMELECSSIFATDNPVPAGNVNSGLTWMEAGPASKRMYKSLVLDFLRLACLSGSPGIECNRDL